MSPSSKNKYLKPLPTGKTEIDVYDVLEVFDVHCPARQHALKKVLFAGLRGKCDTIQDLDEAIQSLQRAVELERERTGYMPSDPGAGL